MHFNRLEKVTSENTVLQCEKRAHLNQIEQQHKNISNMNTEIQYLREKLNSCQTEIVTLHGEIEEKNSQLLNLKRVESNNELRHGQNFVYANQQISNYAKFKQKEIELGIKPGSKLRPASGEKRYTQGKYENYHQPISNPMLAKGNTKSYMNKSITHKQ